MYSSTPFDFGHMEIFQKKPICVLLNAPHAQHQITNIIMFYPTYIASTHEHIPNPENSIEFFESTYIFFSTSFARFLFLFFILLKLIVLLPHMKCQSAIFETSKRANESQRHNQKPLQWNSIAFFSFWLFGKCCLGAS